MTVRLALIGAGLMGADHARIFAGEVPGAAIVAVCDADAGRAGAVAGAHGAEACRDAEAAIARADVDAVVIASPDHTHAPLGIACIRAGKPVLCEKPLSQSPAECREVIAAERAAGRRLVMLGFMRRHDRGVAEMRAARADGSLGRVLMMHLQHRNVETPSAGFTGAMAITNSAPHEFDVARHVLGTEFAGVSAHQPRRSDDRVAPVVMVLDTADGQLVTIEVNNNAAYGYDVRAELVGEAGTLASTPVSYTRRDANLRGATTHDPDWRDRYAEAYRRQNRDFLRFVRTGAFPEVAADCWDGLAAAVAARAGVRALETGARAAVELEARPTFYERTAA